VRRQGRNWPIGWLVIGGLAIIGALTNSHGENIIGVLAVLLIFGTPLALFLVPRVLAHRERVEMIRNGVAPGVTVPPGSYVPPRAPQPPPSYQRATTMPSMDMKAPENPYRLMTTGIRLAAIGLALLIGLAFIGLHHHYNDDGVLVSTWWEPGPWLLGGLIPFFIGMSQVAVAMLSGVQPVAFNTWQGPGPQQPPQPPPSYPPGPAQAKTPPTYDTSYTYRPGDTQELRPPVPPPDRR